MLGIIVSERKDSQKAERIIQRFSNRFAKTSKQSTVFTYMARPYRRSVCIECKRRVSVCPLTHRQCAVERAINDALLGLRALEYARVDAQLTLTV